jgi:hypothetical protein
MVFFSFSHFEDYPKASGLEMPFWGRKIAKFWNGFRILNTIEYKLSM